MLKVMIVSAAWVITVIFLVSVISGFISQKVSNRTYGSKACADKKLPEPRPEPVVTVVKVAVRAVPVYKAAPRRLWEIKNLGKNAFKQNSRLLLPAGMRHIDMVC